jgi:hypothetical protein
MTHTFEYHPIETAPKDRAIMLLYRGEWHIGRWERVNGCERWPRFGGKWCNPACWAEIADMQPEASE